MKNEPDFTEKRIKNVTEAKSVYNNLVDSDNKMRGKSRAQARNQIEGGLPRNPSKLKARGRGWESNQNFGTAKADFDRAAIPYFKVIHDQPRVTAVTVHTPTPDADKWQTIIEEVFDRFLEDWGGDHFTQFISMSNNHIGFGIGTAFFQDENTARWKSVPRGSIQVHDGVPANVEEFEFCFIKHTITGSKLYGHLRNAVSSQRGWNTKAIKAILIQVFDENRPKDRSAKKTSWEEVETAWRDNALGQSCSASVIELATMFVVEWNGNLSRRVFATGYETDDYVFQEENIPATLEQMLHCIFFEIPLDEPTFHGIKGFAVKNYAHSLNNDILWNRILTSTVIGMSLNFKSTGKVSGPPIMNFGPVNVVDPALEQYTVYPQLTPVLSVVEQLGQNRAENSFQYRQQSRQIEKSNTATQAEILSGISSSASESTMSLYLSQVSRLFSEQIRRLITRTSEDSAKFIKRCDERGLPKEILKKLEFTVRTRAQASTALAALRGLLLDQVLQLMPHRLVNDRWVLETWFGHKFGSQSVNKAILPEGEEENLHAVNAAMQENDSLSRGYPLPAARDHDHVAHLNTHIPPMMQIVEGYKQTQNIQGDQGMALQFGLPHIEQHLQFLSEDQTRKEDFNRFKGVAQELRGAVDGIFTQLEARQNQNAPA